MPRAMRSRAATRRLRVCDTMRRPPAPARLRKMIAMENGASAIDANAIAMRSAIRKVRCLMPMVEALARRGEAPRVYRSCDVCFR